MNKIFKLSLILGIPALMFGLGWQIMEFGRPFKHGMVAGEIQYKKGVWEFLKRPNDPYASEEVIRKFGLSVRWIENTPNDTLEKWVGGYNAAMMAQLKERMGAYYYKDAELMILHPQKK